MNKECPFCSRKFEAKKKIAISLDFSYLICSFCSGGVISPKSKFQLFKKKYYSRKYFRELSKPISNSFFQWFLTQRLYQTPDEWVKNNFIPGKILDVGCGNGEFLNQLTKYGWRVKGIDVSRIAVKNTAQKVGKGNIILVNLLRKRIDGKFDIISFWHVLEHVFTPLDYVKKAKDLLNKKSYLIGEVPNLDSVVFRVYGNYYCWVMVPEHVLYFSEKSLKILFKNAGFKDVKVLFPARGLLNFSFSFKNFLSENRVPSLITKTLFIFSIPFSILLGLIFVLLRKGEVIRFYARK